MRHQMPKTVMMRKSLLFFLVYPKVAHYNNRAAKADPGCLAQMGEHLFDVQKVGGSIPSAPTRYPTKPCIAKAFFVLDIKGKTRIIDVPKRHAPVVQW